MPEDRPAAAKVKARPAPRPEPPPRSRHPEPPLPPSGNGGRLLIAVIAFVALVFLILSFANRSSYRIEDQLDTARLVRGRFLPWGQTEVTPPGGDAAFNPIPWHEPPPGAATRGSLRKVADTYYAMLYLAAGEAQDDPAQFDAYDLQASAFETWFDERFGKTPEALDEMSELRSQIRARRKATAEYRDTREEVLQLIEEMLEVLPERAPAALEADAERFRELLIEAREVGLDGRRRNKPKDDKPPEPAEPAAVVPVQ